MGMEFFEFKRLLDEQIDLSKRTNLFLDLILKELQKPKKEIIITKGIGPGR